MLGILPWMPSAQMRTVEEQYSKQLGLKTYHAKWGVAQLLHAGLDVGTLGHHVDLERMNWDSVLAMDFATLASILCTNNLSPTSWAEFRRMLDLYGRSWKSRFALSFCCEATSKVGYVGMPLYESEIRGYRVGAFHVEGFLDVLERDEEGAFGWIMLQILDKLSDSDLHLKLLEMLGGKDRELAYPFLLFGAGACASYRNLEKAGGREAVIGPSVPREVASEVYMMLVCCTSHLIHASQKVRRSAHEELCRRLQIEEVTHFGADTSIRMSPHFVFLQGEIGHLCFPGAGEVPDFLTRMQVQMATRSSSDRERSFDRVTDTSPPEMAAFVARHRVQKEAEERGSKYHISQDWLAERKKPYFP